MTDEHIRLGTTSTQVVVDAARGGRLASLTVDGVERLVGSPVNGRAGDIGWGCFVMAPWVGRLAAGRFPWNGSALQMPRNQGEHAIHGLVFDRAWRVEHRGATSTELRCEFPGGTWPFGGHVRHRVEVEDYQLTLSVEAVAGPESFPIAVGWHPWFRRPQGGDISIGVDASEVLECRELVPTGRRIPVDGLTDLRRAPKLGDRRLDHTYVDVASPVTITWPDLEFEMHLDDRATSVVVHTPVEGVCVEPQTAWPNAHGLRERGIGGTGLRMLLPGERMEVATRWQLRSVVPDRTRTDRETTP